MIFALSLCPSLYAAEQVDFEKNKIEKDKMNTRNPQLDDYHYNNSFRISSIMLKILRNCILEVNPDQDLSKLRGNHYRNDPDWGVVSEINSKMRYCYEHLSYSPLTLEKLEEDRLSRMVFIGFDKSSGDYHIDNGLDLSHYEPKVYSDELDLKKWQEIEKKYEQVYLLSKVSGMKSKVINLPAFSLVRKHAELSGLLGFIQKQQSINPELKYSELAEKYFGSRLAWEDSFYQFIEQKLNTLKLESE